MMQQMFCCLLSWWLPETKVHEFTFNSGTIPIYYAVADDSITIWACLNSSF